MAPQASLRRGSYFSAKRNQERRLSSNGFTFFFYLDKTAPSYLPPEVARGAYFHGRHILFAMKYFLECTYGNTFDFGGVEWTVH